MKIALVVPGGVDRSGTHRVVPCLLWLIERLAREHELHVFSLLQDPWPCSYPLLGAQVHNMGARPRRLRALSAVLREHRRGPFDVVHGIWAVPAGVVAAAAGRLLRRSVLIQIAGGEMAALPEIGYGASRTRRGRAWLRRAAAGADRVTVPSEELRRQAARFGIAADRLPFGVALDRWPARPPRPRPAGQPARLLWVGTQNRVKDPELLLRTAAALRHRGYELRLDVVGEDLLNGMTQRRASDLRLADVVRFHGFRTHHELRAVFDEADVLVVTSRYEAGPLVALEAAVAGVPAVGSHLGHLVDWVPDAALTAPVGDANALADVVAQVLEDDTLRVRLAAAAQRRAVAEDADWTAARVVRLYHELANGKGTRWQSGDTRTVMVSG